MRDSSWQATNPEVGPTRDRGPTNIPEGIAPLGASIPNDPPFISAGALKQLMSMSDAIELIEEAMRRLSADEGALLERWLLPLAPSIKMGLMPGASSAIGQFGIKVLALTEGSGDSGHPSHQGLMLIFDAANARPLCIIDGDGLTTLRTAAATAVATRALARVESRVLAIAGCGQLARPHIDAIRLVRPIGEVRLWNRTPERAEALARDIEGVPISVASSVEAAVAGADIICTLTSSPHPVLKGEWLEAGQHINLVGSSTALPREADETAVARARYFADSRPHARLQAGELRSALAAGAIGEEHLLGEIGEVLAGRLHGRETPSDITIYKSLGHIVQDLSVGDAALQRWHDRGTDRSADFPQNGSSEP